MPRGVKTTIVVAALTLTCASVAVAMVLRALHEVPEFYDAAVAIRPETQTGDRDAFVARAAALASDLHSVGRWQSLFSVDEINAWLALELANNYPDLLPPELQDPRLSISNSAATIGCQYRTNEFSAIVSVEVEAFLQQSNVVAIRIRQARAGALPVPLGNFLDSISYAAERLNLDLRWRTSQGDPVALITLPTLSDKNSEPLRLDSLELRDGELFVAGTVGVSPDSAPVIPEPLRAPTAQLDPLEDEQPRIGSAEKETLQK